MHGGFFRIALRSHKNGYEQPICEYQKVMLCLSSGPDRHFHYFLLCGIAAYIRCDLVYIGDERHPLRQYRFLTMCDVSRLMLEAAIWGLLEPSKDA